ncbi:DoxX family protein [Salinisphaera aquimarina]|uniref:DoxX family protein n=1 Tax=Salinisphaera aquimarina TaxID=2094031 RepID=A0ABV7EMG0_9GAMM
MTRVSRTPAYPLATHSWLQFGLLLGISGFFLMGGIGHFALARFFVAIVPAYIPEPRLMVAISGTCELLGAVGLLWPRSRRVAGIGLLLLIVAVFPANLNMALHAAQFPAFAPWMLYLRLPLQLVLLAWVVSAVGLRRHGKGIP